VWALIFLGLKCVVSSGTQWSEEYHAHERLRSFASLRMTFSNVEIRVFCGWVIRYLPKKYKHPAASMKGKVSRADNEKVGNSFNLVFGIYSSWL
jgi:hypothetical protein